jgi:hypothetical protein
MRLLHGSSGQDLQERKMFFDWVLGIGDGTVGENNDVDMKLDIPDDLLIRTSDDPVAAIVEAIYPSLLENMKDPSFFQDRAILTPKNAIVDLINDHMMKNIPGEEKEYLSYDSPDKDNDNSGVDRPDDIHTPEFLNTINCSGLPNHKLKLKVGVPIMLLRNVDPSVGLCNGTRLIITQMGTYIIEAKVISGSNIGEKDFIPRLSLTPSYVLIPFKFQRWQFPISVSFAMTINKSQGQSLKHVGVYLPQSVFSHGQLYVAISRVTSRHELKMLLVDDDGNLTNTTSNVVYQEIFRNL